MKSGFKNPHSNGLLECAFLKALSSSGTEGNTRNIVMDANTIAPSRRRDEKRVQEPALHKGLRARVGGGYSRTMPSSSQVYFFSKTSPESFQPFLSALRRKARKCSSMRRLAALTK